MKKFEFQHYFKNKKITLMGLGILGRGIAVANFLAGCGANITITDLKTKKELAPALVQLKKLTRTTDVVQSGGYKNIKYTLGKHDFKDFKDKDMIIKSAGVSLDSKYIAYAKKNKIPIVMDASLFMRLAKGVKIIGITGTRGKSMTTALIFHILKQNEKKLSGKIYIGGNMRGMATLPLLAEVKKGDIIVLELDSWQCQGLHDEKISPQIAIFTSFMSDHMNYYKNSMKNYFNDKESIFKYQKMGDSLIISSAVQKLIRKQKVKGHLIIADIKKLKEKIKEVKINIIGDHNLQNACVAYQVAIELGLSEKSIFQALKSFSGLEGRLQSLGKIKGVEIINDNNATTPQATIAGLKAVVQEARHPKEGLASKYIILIAGGADKNLDLIELKKVIQKYCKAVVLLPGTGTERLGLPVARTVLATNLKDAVSHAFKIATKNDTILFSPAFASFGLFKNEYERNDEFLKIIKSLK